MDISTNPAPLSILSFASSSTPSSSSALSHPNSFALGSDCDIGGLSTSALTPISTDTSSHIVFHGNLSLAVPPQYQGKIRTGYAAFRTKTRPTLFGEETWDMSLYTHLKVVVGYRGWQGWRDRWVVNLQTDGPVRYVHFPMTNPSGLCTNVSDPIYTNIAYPSLQTPALPHQLHLSTPPHPLHQSSQFSTSHSLHLS